MLNMIVEHYYNYHDVTPRVLPTTTMEVNITNDVVVGKIMLLEQVAVYRLCCCYTAESVESIVDLTQV